MSPTDRAYMLGLGRPLTQNERDVALEMHDGRARIIQINIRRLQAELEIQNTMLGLERSTMKTLADDWPDCGPNTMLHISATERRRMTEGVPAVEIEIRHLEQHVIHPRYVPAETEELATTN